MVFTVSIAGVNISVTSIYDEAYELCRDYLTDGEPEFSVSVSAEDIARERELNFREAAAEGIPVVDYPDSYLETLAVYRKIASAMLGYDTFLMHGAVVAVGDKAWMFTASSGTGKTTHINLWLKHIEGSYVVNGDKPLIHIGDEVTVYGTPWAGKEGMQRNLGVDLCGIVILERGEKNLINRITFSEAMPMLIQQSYRPDEKSALEKALELIGKLGKRIPLYRLQCNMLPEAALTAYGTLSGDAAKNET
jgi:hypothetical protein